jgi:hypothetical protein
LVRALLVLVVVAMPALLLPNVSQAAQEISLIIGGIAGAFTLFEYASSHPGLIDFRFAPPYNRIRFFTFFTQIVALIFLSRAVVNADAFSADILKYADQAVALTNVPLSPVRVAVAMIGEGASEEFRLLLARAASVSFLIAFAFFILFALTLWVFRWPVGRDNFNLWVNLPTFEPSSGRDVERRLFRDGTANVLIGIGLPFLIPVVASRSGGWFDPSVLENDQPLIWGCAIWAFLPASLVMRGAALLKVGWLVKRARG